MEKANVVLHAYCVMPNHYHLFVETPMGNIQRFMQTLNTSYAMYYRYKHNRPGHCWQGRYGAKLVRDDKYVLGLTRYIHLNPVKTKGWKDRGVAEKMRRLREWEWSSYGGYAGFRDPEERVSYRTLELMGRMTAGGNRRAYRKYIQEMMVKDDEEFLKGSSSSGYAIGDEDYRDEIAGELKGKMLERAVTGDVVWPEDRLPGMEAIEKEVIKEFGVGRDDLHFHGRRAGVAKSVAIELCCMMSGESQRAVGGYFGYEGDGGVSKQRKRLEATLAANGNLAAKMERLKGNILKSITKMKVKRVFDN